MSTYFQFCGKVIGKSSASQKNTLQGVALRRKILKSVSTPFCKKSVAFLDEALYCYYRNEDAASSNSKTVVAHTAFGMNHEYRCEAEAWGSKGILRATRIFTAGTDFAPQFELMIGGKQQRLEQKPDHQFLKSIHYFADCMEQPAMRAEAARQILKQSTMIEIIRDAAAKV